MIGSWSTTWASGLTSPVRLFTNRVRIATRLSLYMGHTWGTDVRPSDPSKAHGADRGRDEPGLGGRGARPGEPREPGGVDADPPLAPGAPGRVRRRAGAAPVGQERPGADDLPGDDPQGAPGAPAP